MYLSRCSCFVIQWWHVWHTAVCGKPCVHHGLWAYASYGLQLYQCVYLILWYYGHMHHALYDCMLYTVYNGQSYIICVIHRITICVHTSLKNSRCSKIFWDEVDEGLEIDHFEIWLSIEWYDDSPVQDSTCI